jgi:hypothetical protein
LVADFVQKGQKRGRTSGKFVFILFFSLILGKSKKYYNFPIDTDKDKFVSKDKKRLHEEKISTGPIFFPQCRIFPPKLAKKSLP